jgi:pantoate--beta-alanine ligase
MDVVHTRSAAREWVAGQRAGGAGIALVPTMGDLHDGHLSLGEAARRHASAVAMSIFVNPLQFGPAEDFERYPRNLERDAALAREAGFDLVFAPARGEMFPDGEPWIVVEPVRGASTLCGRSRPGHFRGVLTVVARLFGIFSPDVAVFGQKDFQQLTLIRRMAGDLELPIRIVAAPTVRDADGLALSSRNRYLSAAGRVRALSLVSALRDCADLFARGERDACRYRERLRDLREPEVVVEYGEVVDPRSLDPVERVEAGSVCAVAARVGSTRLIDNLVLGNG